MKGGCFLYNSTAYSLTRLLTGQLAGVIDVGNRVLRDFPDTRDRWIEVGRGKIVALCTYDIAAAVLIAQEGGAIVTDAYGRALDAVPLLDTSEQNLQTICAASNPVIHRSLLDAINLGFEKFAASRL
jgi:myo-inositol-1(or 4)-monophosphatase